MLSFCIFSTLEIIPRILNNPQQKVAGQHRSWRQSYTFGLLESDLKGAAAFTANPQASPAPKCSQVQQLDTPTHKIVKQAQDGTHGVCQ